MSSHADAAFFLVIFGVFATVGAVSWYFSKDQKVKRALKRTRPTRVREVSDGKVVKVVGKVRYVGEPLEAPLSGRSCAHYRVTVTEKHGKSSSQIIKDEMGIDFYVIDDTGAALVSMESAVVAVTHDDQQSSGVFNDANERMEALLQRHGKSSTGWIFNRSVRYEEGVLEEGEEVAVLGLARWEADATPGPLSVGGGYRDAPRRLVIKAPGEAEPVRISDDPGVLT